jgi:hypothetical protein
MSPLGEGEQDPVTRHTVRSQRSRDTYTIVAVPPKPEMLTYILVDTGEITP